MALIDKASLLMVPSTYEAGKLYNVLPSGNRAPDSTDQNSGYDNTRADFDFDRGSNAAATRVNAAGLIEKYRENVLTESNNFSDSSWVKYQGGSLTSGQADKDGGANAWKLDIVNSQAYSGLYKLLSGSDVRTQSIYAKAGTLDRLGIVNMTGTGFAAWFDLTSGTIGTQGSSNIDAKIESVGTDGWYRISITQSVSANYFQLKPSDGETTPSGANGFIYIMNAQLESGLVATDVLTSGATTAKAGVLVDLPRINYDANGNNGALLLEPSRKNVVTNSEYVSSSDYVVGNWTGTITTNTTETLSPEGVYNATKFVKAGASDRVYFHNSQPDGAYTGSIYLKAASGSENKTIEISVRRFGGGGGATTKLVTITSEWQRFDVTATNLTGGTTTAMYISDFSSAGTATEFYSYAMQIEAASYSSSYIPNHGTSGGVTRAADSCSVTGASDVIGQTEGTLYAEAKIKGLKNSNTIVTLHNGSFAEYLVIAGNNSGNINAYIFAGGVQQAGIFSGTYAVDSVVKCAMAYKENDVAFYINGVLIGTDSSATMASTSVFDVGSISFGNYPLHGTIKQATLFNERLTNAELAALTA